MALKRLTIIVWLCALCYLEPGLTKWNFPAPLLVPKQWGSTPNLSSDTFSALHQFIQQLVAKQHDNEGHKRVKMTPVMHTVAQPCSKLVKLFMGGPGKEVEDLLSEKGHKENIHVFTDKKDGVLMRIRVSQTTPNSQSPEVERVEKEPLQRTAESDAVHRVEKESERYGKIVWVISFHRVCLLVTMGLLARISMQILLQKAELQEGQKGWDLPESCFSTLVQNRPGLHAASRRRRRGKRSGKGC